MKDNAIKKGLKENAKAKRDEQVVRDAISAVETLRDLGIQPRSYRLKSPFQRTGKLAPAMTRYGSYR